MVTPFVSHVEWGTPDPSVLQQFLTKLFGWQFQPFAPHYLIYLPSDGGISVGILQSDQVRPGGTPNVSIRVVDLPAVVASAKALSGKIVVPVTPMGSGFFAFVAAPDGNLIGLQQT
jgi:predicted enzyme related to lactoylglutathione lyase